MSVNIFIIVIFLAFCAEYVDSTLGMGYGTSLTPILLLLGFHPLQIVPAILFSEFLTGSFAGLTHHWMGNINLSLFKRKNYELTDIRQSHLKIALILGGCSFLGALTAVIVSVNIPVFYMKLYIGCLVLAIGLYLLTTINKQKPFSWKNLLVWGVIASFNKGISGGGYGPVVTGGQIISGVESKSAVAITSVAESLTCLVGLSAYLFVLDTLSTQLFLPLTLGGLISVPFAGISVKKAHQGKLQFGIGFMAVILGFITLFNLFILNI